MSSGRVEGSSVRKESVSGLRPGCAGSAARTMIPASSIQTPFGTFTIPNSSSTTCPRSTSDGCAGAARSMYGLGASASTSSATVTTSRPWGCSSSRSACHPGRSDRQPHHDAQATRSTFWPRSDDSSNASPSMVGSVQLGGNRRGQRLARSRPSPGRGPRSRAPRRPPGACRADRRAPARRCDRRRCGRRPAGARRRPPCTPRRPSPSSRCVRPAPRDRRRARRAASADRTRGRVRSGRGAGAHPDRVGGVAVDPLPPGATGRGARRGCCPCPTR